MSDERRGDRENMVSLHYHIDRLFSEYKEAHAREHELIADGVDRARSAMDKRLDAMNELRAQILEERGGLATKEWVGVKVEDLQRALQAHIDATRQAREEATKERLNARRGMIGLVATNVVTVAVALIALFT